MAKRQKKSWLTTFPRITLLIILLASLGLRLWQVSKSPPALYWDEMDAGYQAYTFLHTGKDYFGNALPLQFHSFAEYKSPLYIYLTVPFVALFGLSAVAVRTPSVVAAVVSIIAIYLLHKELTGKETYAFLPALVMALAPWHFQYSRLGFEVMTMLPFFLFGLWSFLKGLKNPRWFYFSIVCFSLAVYSYSTAKFFVPAIVLVLIGLYYDRIKQLPSKRLIHLALLVVIVSLPLLYTNLLGKGGQRFSEIAIYTDPTIPTEINYLRTQSALASGKEPKVGLTPSMMDKLAYNKPFYIVDQFTTNYLEAFSSEFLFIKGDANPRHSPAKEGIAEMDRITAIALVLGLLYLAVNKRDLSTRNKIFLVAWLLLAPMPAALTREGSGHATRLFFMLPIIILLIGFGFILLLEKLHGKWRFILFSGYTFIWFIETLLFFHYYFGLYRFESAPAFQYGFDQAVKIATANEKDYDTVIIDAYEDSPLLAYLFINHFDPKQFQQMHPLPQTKVVDGVQGVKLGKTILLPPGERSWPDVFTHNSVTGKILLIVSADQLKIHTNDRLTNLPDTSRKGTIYYPNGEIAFFVLEHAPAQ